MYYIVMFEQLSLHICSFLHKIVSPKGSVLGFVQVGLEMGGLFFLFQIQYMLSYHGPTYEKPQTEVKQQDLQLFGSSFVLSFRVLTTGIDCVQVPHFTKYGIVEEGDEDIEPTEQEKMMLKAAEEKQRAVQVSVLWQISE